MRRAKSTTRWMLMVEAMIADSADWESEDRNCT